MGGAIWAIARRPRLWTEAVRTLVAFSPRRWWRSFPFVPRIEPLYASWRIETAYGSGDAEMGGRDLVAYLEWRKRQRRAS